MKPVHHDKETRDDSPTASLIGIGIPALVIAAVAAAYFLVPRSDDQFNQVQATPPATTEPAPKTNSDQIKVNPASETKAPPAAETKPNELREPRTDSQNAN